MKRTLLLTVAVLCIASMAMAQANVGSLGVYSDQAGTSCDITDLNLEVVTAYILHVNADEANTSQFKLQQDTANINMTFLGGQVNPSYLSLGTLENGILITYGGCRTSFEFPLTLVTLTWFGTGTTTSCAKVSIVGDPLAASGEVEVVDCSSNKIVLGPVAGSAMVHSTPGACNCDVATHETSWSQIKALYQ
jgi:hypothetical protein